MTVPPGSAPGEQPPQPPLPGYPGPGAPPAFAYPGVGEPTAQAPLSPGAQRLGWAIAGLGVLVFIFAFLPWATLGPFTVSGVGGDNVGGTKDGVITLLFGLICVAAGVTRGLSKRPGGLPLAAGVVGLLMGALTTIVALADISDISGTDDSLFAVSVGSGLYLTLVAGIALVVVSIAAIVKRR